MAAPSRVASTTSRPSWLTPDRFPFESHFADIGGSLVHYVDEGSGPALLIVSPGFWTFMFRDLILKLRDHFRCITLDFPGSGLSIGAGAGANDQSVAPNGVLLEEFVRLLDLQDVTLLLHDVGGPIGFLFAGRNPARCRAFIIANTFCWPLRDYPYVRSMLRLIGTPLFGAVNSNLNVLARVTVSGMGAGRRFDRRDRAIFGHPWRSRSTRRTSQRVLADAGRVDTVLAELERVLPDALGSLPVLTLFGRRNDRWGWQARFATMFENVTTRWIEDGNHFPFCDDPDGFSAEIVEWWERVVAQDFRVARPAARARQPDSA